MSLEKFLDKICPEKEKRSDVSELILDQIKTRELKDSEKALLNQFSNVMVFSMNDCGLRSLNNFPDFNELETVISDIYTLA
jgi:hypothetical protein